MNINQSKTISGAFFFFFVSMEKMLRLLSSMLYNVFIKDFTDWASLVQRRSEDTSWTFIITPVFVWLAWNNGIKTYRWNFKSFAALWTFSRRRRRADRKTLSRREPGFTVRRILRESPRADEWWRNESTAPRDAAYL